jgi:hypothetical protein
MRVAARLGQTSREATPDLVQLEASRSRGRCLGGHDGPARSASKAWNDAERRLTRLLHVVVINRRRSRRRQRGSHARMRRGSCDETSSS